MYFFLSFFSTFYFPVFPHFLVSAQLNHFSIPCPHETYNEVGVSTYTRITDWSSVCNISRTIKEIVQLASITEITVG